MGAFDVGVVLDKACDLKAPEQNESGPGHKGRRHGACDGRRHPSVRFCDGRLALQRTRHAFLIIR